LVSSQVKKVGSASSGILLESSDTKSPTRDELGIVVLFECEDGYGGKKEAKALLEVLVFDPAVNR
jgi:hypothetical protein